MANKRLTDEVIAARMVELRNLRMLHARNRRQITALKADNHELRELLNQALAQNKTQAIQIAELQTMVFGKKRRPPTGTVVPVLDEPAKQPRTKASYRRPIPPTAAITTQLVVPLPDHCQCGGELQNITTHVRYQEDIPLPELTPDYRAKLVTKYVISRGVCTQCGKVTSSKYLGGQAVTLGSNVRLLMCHLISVVGMSYAQVTRLLLSLYGLAASDGEIANTLQKQHQAWLPAYGQLKADIRAAPAVHADETPWAIQQNNGYGYAWSLSDATSPKVYFSLENSRGAVHAKNLFGDQFTGVRISDDYGAYRALPGTQQLCWAHLYRAIRDLRYNDNLPEELLPDVSWWYEQFAGIYQDLRKYLAEPYEPSTRTIQSNELWQRLQALFPANDHEPMKLKRLKAQLQRAGQTKLFACLIHDSPCDNNRAERDLRQLVLKRKRSFGSQTEKGAKALATILSVCTTTWRIQPASYFQSLAQLG
jgi:transposase